MLLSLVLVVLGGCTRAGIGPETMETPGHTSPSPAGVPVEHLAVGGAIHATTARTSPGSGHGCTLQDGTLTFQSDAMEIRDSPNVARVQIELTGVDHAGRYSATQPLQQYRRTPVRVSVAPNAASGTATGFYVATAGRVAVSGLGPDDRPRGTYGSVDADLTLQGDNRTIHLRGTWVC